MGQARTLGPTLVAGDLLRRGLLVAPLVVAWATGLRGVEGGLSAVAGLVLALANLVVSARGLDWAAGVSLTLVAAVALGGYVLRLAVITTIVLLLGQLAWVDLPALAMSLALAHLGLLTIEAAAQ